MRSNYRGFTLIELMLAVTVTGFVSITILGVYTNVVKAGVRQQRMFKKVNAQVVNKARIDRLFSDIKIINEISPVSIEFTGNKSNTNSSVILRDNTLYLNNKPYLSGIESCKWKQILPEAGNKQYSLLLWEITQSKDAWIGGAKKIGN